VWINQWLGPEIARDPNLKEFKEGLPKEMAFKLSSAG